ncbi:unnamed protein product [Symbiodinium sp. CCMP2592]|nr:unnamed protein product [Symbiodinium sp. CCMP2592]
MGESLADSAPSKEPSLVRSATYLRRGGDCLRQYSRLATGIPRGRKPRSAAQQTSPESAASCSSFNTWRGCSCSRASTGHEAAHHIVFDLVWHMCNATEVRRTHEVNEPQHFTLRALDPGMELLHDALDPMPSRGCLLALLRQAMEELFTAALLGILHVLEHGDEFSKPFSSKSAGSCSSVAVTAAEGSWGGCTRPTFSGIPSLPGLLPKLSQSMLWDR